MPPAQASHCAPAARAVPPWRPCAILQASAAVGSARQLAAQLAGAVLGTARNASAATMRLVATPDGATVVVAYGSNVVVGTSG